MRTRALVAIAAVSLGLGLMLGFRAGASPPPGRYDVGTDTVLDTKTGLTWQRTASTQAFLWHDAQNYCPTLTVGGLSWRMPTIKELLTLVDERTYNPAIDTTAFPGTLAWPYWSLSPAAGNPQAGWGVNFFNGVARVGDVDLSAPVRCVHAP